MSSRDARPPDRHDTANTEMTFDSLPNELISLIFTHMYKMSCKEAGSGKFFVETGMDVDEYCDQDMTWKDEDLLDPYVFPKAIAAVCQRWREIAERLPILWTRIVAFVDSSPTPLSIVQAYLTLSRDLPLHVYILRRPDTDLGRERERQICRDFINILIPHVRRCQKIEFDVIYSSSLPSISKDFLGCAPLLKTLNLKCRTDDGVASGGPDPRPEIDNEPFSTPALKDLSVDGRNFVHASLALPSWIESIPTSHLRLGVHNFYPSDSISQDLQFDLYDFIGVLHHLQVVRLSLSNVEFHDYPTVVPDVLLSADTLELDRLSYDTFLGIMAFTAHEGMESIRISQCEVAHLGEAVRSDFLALEGISAGTDLSGFLQCWSGRELNISNCPGFYDIALETLGNMDNARIRSLIIEDCQNFSPEAVMETVRRLNECVALQRRDGCLDREKCALDNLSILGHPHVLTPAEELWFTQNASSGEFVWAARK